MKALFISSTLLVLLTTNCGQSVPTDLPAKSQSPGSVGQQDTSVIRKSEQHLVLASTVQDTNHLASDQIVEHLLKSFAYPKTWPDLRHYSKKVELISSTDNTFITDSIITYSLDNNSFTYLKSGDVTNSGATLMRCRIASAPTYLPKNIHLGMSKSELAQVISKPFDTDVLLISEQEGYQKFYFSFKNKRLQTIVFDSDYID